jgi:glycosyltransferase involved in cell wall biosynthesis
MNPGSSLISVIIPVYNAGKYLEETIRSVLDQSYSNWELILINDGSTDASENIIHPFLSDPRIKYYKQLNAGVSVARNKGMELSSGKFLAFLDADDRWLAENLEKKIRYLSEHSEVAWVFSDIRFLDDVTKEVKPAPTGRDDQILKSLLLWEGEVVPGPSSNIVVRRTCYESGIRFETALSTTADRCFCTQLALSFIGKRIPEVLVEYRILPTSMSRNMVVTEHDNLLFYRKYCKKEFFNSFWFRQRCFSNIYFILAGSWFRQGAKPMRACYFALRSVLCYPPKAIHLFNKALKVLLNKSVK